MHVRSWCMWRGRDSINTSCKFLTHKVQRIGQHLHLFLDLFQAYFFFIIICKIGHHSHRSFFFLKSCKLLDKFVIKVEKENRVKYLENDRISKYKCIHNKLSLTQVFNHFSINLSFMEVIFYTFGHVQYGEF